MVATSSPILDMLLMLWIRWPGRLTASVSPRKLRSTVQVWDAADGGHVFTYPGHHELCTQCVVARWHRIASGSFGWNVQV